MEKSAKSCAVCISGSSHIGGAGHGKDVEKNFFTMEKYEENVTKRRKTVIFRAFCAKKRDVCTLYLVLTYWAEHHIML